VNIFNKTTFARDKKIELYYILKTLFVQQLINNRLKLNYETNYTTAAELK